jgi:MEMO1 family protein
MINNSPLVFVGIAPHPPIMVPEVGGARTREVRASVEAMRELTGRVKDCGAETIVLVSPHAPLERDSFVAYGGALLRGDFANFRAPQAIVEAPLDEELLGAVREAAAEEQYRVVDLGARALDHGTAVPLYFLLSNGWVGRVVALGYSFLPDDDHARFGKCVRRAVERTGRPTAFVASGDLSHRLTPDAPAGFHPQAHRFDEEVVNSLRLNEPGRIFRIDRGLRRLAGECGYRSMLVALGAAAGSEDACEVIHYEAPFGVGYLVAQLSRSTLN